MKIFISYNHKDQATALKISDRLKENGFDVIIDVDKMRTGQNIEQFIRECIKESGTTLSLISTTSLLSAWVAMETVLSKVDTSLRDRYLVPCYIDKTFFDREFTSRALDQIDNELQKINALMKEAIDKERGIEDLQTERTRYNKLRTNLPEIIGEFRNSLCIDLTEENFDAGMQKIIRDLKSSSNMPDAETGIKEQVANAKSKFEDLISNTLDDASKQRLSSLSNRLTKLQDLLEKYEQEIDLETDPKRQMRYEAEMEKVKKNIQQCIGEMSQYQ